MKPDTVSLLVAAWGAVTGTFALVIQFLVSRRDRARLKVKATMSFGGDVRFGKENQHFLTVELTNTGGGIIRIRRFGMASRSKYEYRTLKFINRLRKPHKRVSESVGIYSGSMDPIDDILAQPNVISYPPKNIILENCEAKEIRVGVAEELLPTMPTRGLLIVTDHLGRDHLVGFNMMCKKEKRILG